MDILKAFGDRLEDLMRIEEKIQTPKELRLVDKETVEKVREGKDLESVFKSLRWFFDVDEQPPK